MLNEYVHYNGSPSLTWDADLALWLDMLWERDYGDKRKYIPGEAAAQDLASRLSPAGFVTTSGTVRSKIQIRHNADMETLMECL